MNYVAQRYCRKQRQGNVQPNQCASAVINTGINSSKGVEEGSRWTLGVAAARTVARQSPA